MIAKAYRYTALCFFCLTMTTNKVLIQILETDCFRNVLTKKSLNPVFLGGGGWWENRGKNINLRKSEGKNGNRAGKKRGKGGKKRESYIWLVASYPICQPWISDGLIAMVSVPFQLFTCCYSVRLGLLKVFFLYML